MLRLQQVPEPEDFDTRVRQPGIAFLKETGITSHQDLPSNFPWKDYWRHVLPELREGYQYTCAYLAIRCHERDLSTDHFHHKDRFPQLAYEWANYRLCSRSFNGVKSTAALLDPFEIEDDWIELNLLDGSLFSTATTQSLPAETKDLLRTTLEKLNLPSFCKIRREHLDECIRGEIKLSWLEKHSPFVAAQLKKKHSTTKGWKNLADRES